MRSNHCVLALGILDDQGMTLERTSAGAAQPTGTSFGPGTWIVGADIQPGTYRSDPVTGACLWKRLSGFGGDSDEVIAQDLVMEGPTTVTISATDAGFVADEDCGRWTKVR